jgi:hypothetical protein
MFKLFRVPLLVTGLALLLTLIFGGLQAAITVAILGLLEITFSFDNAIVNSKILKRMNAKWQHIFLTLGIVIAVFGMRLVFPLIIVSLSAHISPITALQLALAHPAQYAHHVELAHPVIAGFGGIFLLMLFLDWLFEEKEVYWLGSMERKLASWGKLETLSVCIALIVISIIGLGFGYSAGIAGVFGLLTYLLVSSIDTFFNEDTVATVAKAGLATFIYLEVLDASFSFDGVVGAFAVTNEIFLIAIGLGIGAMFIRTLTVYLTNKGTLGEYRFLEHGAHWAIGTLAILLLLTIKFNIPDVVTGLIGLVIIGAAFWASVRANHGNKASH